jgi:hypothetical protein
MVGYFLLVDIGKGSISTSLRLLMLSEITQNWAKFVSSRISIPIIDVVSRVEVEVSTPLASGVAEIASNFDDPTLMISLLSILCRLLNSTFIYESICDAYGTGMEELSPLQTQRQPLHPRNHLCTEMDIQPQSRGSRSATV